MLIIPLLMKEPCNFSVPGNRDILFPPLMKGADNWKTLITFASIKSMKFNYKTLQEQVQNYLTEYSQQRGNE